MSKKLVVISIDALGADDLSGDLAQTPVLKEFRQRGTHIQNVKAIYPSLTYPSHTTIVTGVYPKTHGIVNNTKIQPQRLSPDWFWYKKSVKVPTLYEVARDAGLKTAAFLWPVTAKSRIDYNIAEIFPNRIWTNQVLISLQASSPLFLLKMNQKYGKLRKGIKQPYLDDFITACAVDTLFTKKPDLALIHLVDMDSMRHAHGVLSKEAEAALLRQDQRVGQIVAATKAAGTFSETVFVILGDHYQIDVNKMIRLNTVFAKKGWLEVNNNGTIKKDWQVYAKNCDGSTYIYCNKNSVVSPLAVKDAIKDIEGVEQIYSTEEAADQGAAPNCTFIVEAGRGYYFTDEGEGETVAEVAENSIGQRDRYRAVHGFSPLKSNYDTTMVVCGPGIAEDKQIKGARLIDEAPTFAKILGLNKFPHNIDGKVIEEIFKKNK